MRTEWMPEHDAALKEFFSAEMSYAEIASAINFRFEQKTSFSRNAAIGRANRLGLRTPVKPKAVPKKRHQAYRPRPKPVETHETIQIRCAEMAPGTLTLLELGPDDCRYPFGEAAPYLFCGEPREHEETSYCPLHTALCQKPRT
jgi:GcrA cell cycle regulator